MGEETGQLLELIELVADGHGDIDWDALIRDAPDDAARTVLRELRTIAGVAHVHATQVADSPTADLSPDLTGSDQPSPELAGFRPPAPAVATKRELPLAPALKRRDGPPTQDEVPTAPVAVAADRSWGNFRLQRKVGEGAYGEVYEAIDTFLDHRVALKLLKPNVGRSRILHEAKLLVGLRHPNVIAVHGADIRQGRTGFWMDFIEGRTLADIVRVEKVRSADEAVVIGGTLCRALAAVHSVGIVHRDIKAQNVMRESGGRIVLMDFGAGEFVDPTRGNVRPAGTPLYLAPELFDGRPASIQSDIYALGVLLFFLVTGLFPYSGSSPDELREAQLLGKRRRLQDLRADVPDAFVAVVDRMLAADPAQRYESATEARAALERVVVAPAPAERTASMLRRAAAVVAMSIIAITFFGLISTRAFNLAFGRSDGFGSESVFEWFVWGLRSMVSPIVRIGGGVILLTGTAALARIIYRLFPAARARVTRFSAACAAFARRHELDDGNMLLQLVIVLGVMMFTGMVWSFWNEITPWAIFVNTAPSADLALLQPAHDRQFSDYSRILEACLFVFGVAAYGVYRIGVRIGRPPRRSITAMAWAVAVLVLVLLRAMPYRIIFQNEMERVDLGPVRCYEIGHDGAELLLLCPDEMPPRNVKVANDDPRLRRRGTVESVFTPRAESRALK